MPTIPHPTPDVPIRPAIDQPTAPPTGRHRGYESFSSDRRSVLWAGLSVTAIVLAWVTVIVVGQRIEVGAGLRQIALFGHLAALVVGFGAALTVEWFGLMWLLRRRSLATVIQTAQGAHLPIWLGLAGLAGSGMLLTPDRLSTATTFKLVAVLVVALNGLYAQRAQRWLIDSGSSISRPVMARVAGAALVSQAGWWTATVIGFLNAQH